IANRLGLKLDYDFNGESYQTVSGQNSNNSVRISNEFFQTLDRDGTWDLKRRTDHKAIKQLKATELWEEIAFAAWRCADPGVQYDTTINQWHTCPTSGRINASNPCVTGDTLVATSTGYKRIKDLVGSTAEVINADGKPVFVDRIFKTGTKPVYQLTTRSGYQVRLTADHQVWTVNRGDVPAAELRTGDRFVLRGAGFGDEWLPDDVAIELGRELAIGGHLGVISDSSELKHAVFTARYRYSEGEHESLRLTDSFFSLCRSSQANILDGLFSASETEVGNLSQELAQQLQIILLSFGLPSSIRADIKVVTTRIGRRTDYQMWKVRLQGASIRQVVKAKVYASNRHASIDDENTRSMVDEFLSLTPCGVEDVYDLTEPSTHHFVANGIVVHNCSEYMFLDNTACNLASFNLLKFYDPQTRVFDIERFEHATELWTVVLEISVLMAAFPSREIARLSYEYRTLGLGYANLGAMLMQAGIAYDSEQGRAICGALSAILTGVCYRTSAKMAEEHGPFPGYYKNREAMLRVIRNHRRAAYGVARDSAIAGKDKLGDYEQLDIKPVPIDGNYLTVENNTLSNAPDLLTHARKAWDEALEEGVRHGYRNAQVTVIAPTGTIGLLMDCDTTGVEPDFALVKFKKLAGGGYFKIANQSVKPALETLGYNQGQIRDILNYVMGHLTLEVPVPDRAARWRIQPRACGNI
ncbi:MAG: vitamin B12-dependent ribonucleotide reductase, partial [Phycisphaerales bacterium]|nr:vitamin B12-dependent ribonucleotide reductase [Phycisphaerales bacterium]